MLEAFFSGGRWLCIKKQLCTQGLECYTHQTLQQCHWLSWRVKADVWLQDDYPALPCCLVLEGFKGWYMFDKFKGVLLLIGFPLGTFISLYTFTIRNWRNIWCILYHSRYEMQQKIFWIQKIADPALSLLWDGSLGTFLAAHWICLAVHRALWYTQIRWRGFSEGWQGQQGHKKIESDRTCARNKVNGCNKRSKQMKDELSGYLLGKNNSTFCCWCFTTSLLLRTGKPPATALRTLGLRSAASFGGRSAAREGGGVLSRTIFVGCGLLPYTYQGEDLSVDVPP